MADVSPLALRSIADLSQGIDRGEFSPVALTSEYLSRIETLDSRLHAFNMVMTERALDEARQAEAEIGAGRRLGPLHGIPIGIKDMIDVAGVPTTAQAVHRRDHIAEHDADVVASLRKAGAIIIGKQAMTEYAVGGTQLDHAWPPARNPWNLDLDALSSSSGSSVSVAAGLCAGSVGTETAGSIRDPAAWNGVAGLKPTNGVASTKGVLPLSRTMDCVGPIAWTVEDCALLLDGMVDAAPRAPTAASELDGGVDGLRVGVVRQYYDGDPDLDASVAAAMERSIEILGRLGAISTTVEVGDFDEYSQIARRISWPEEYAEHRGELERYPDRFTAVSRSRLEDGKAFAAADYILAQHQRTECIERFRQTMRDVDVLVLPTMKKPAQVAGFEFTELGNVELSLSRPFNLLGCPALTLCNGFSDDGLPVAIQFVGRHFEDRTVLRAGHALERALGLRSRRPPIALQA
jgi:aspartyl-tRNA(Asn)/glutamyl-tRNA(Gln) amidotransferase subunit A